MDLSVPFAKGMSMSKASLHYMDLVELENRRRRLEAFRFIVGGLVTAFAMMSLTFLTR